MTLNGDSDEASSATSGLVLPKPGEVTLRSLAPRYVPAQHAEYVRHLEDAIVDTKNKNIALTGRYGSGKSSVLDQFEAKHKDDTLRVSITTLGPDADDDGLTNRIQKELVKQLVYRAKPGRLRRSRFARVAPLTKQKAFVEALALTGLVAGLLWLLGVRPEVTGMDSNHDAVRLLSGVAFAVLVVLAVWLARWLVGDRIISQVETAGTKVTLEAGPDTYFDEYLDEIVAFFDSVEPKFVIFEDLDRFDDPQIFDSLRELNTLINASAHWRDKGQPLRFIYAIKDSLFEKLGADPEPGPPVAAADGADGEAVVTAAGASVETLEPTVAAVQRANRTKFFELVIPVVPFISHRNARDHLVQALKDIGLPEGVVSRPLLDLVARHATDMRLLLNICNEFVVFSEKLLWVKTPAPGMTSDDMFALVAYKNFHLADFEAISQRLSSLDTLENHHRELVRAAIADLQEKRRGLVRSGAVARSQTQTARRLGTQLQALGEALKGGQASRTLAFNVDATSFDVDDVASCEFWEAVATAGSLSVSVARAGGVPPASATLDRSRLLSLFPDGMRAGTWKKLDQTEHTKQLRGYEGTIAFMRGASFDALAGRPEFKLNGKSFDELIDDTLKSELARALVRRGFVNRNYAEFSATFYGEFVGVDVAFFYNHSVQPNQMYLDFQFNSPDAVRNLLEQAPADFTSSVSAFNIEVVSYLLREDPDAAEKVVAFLVSDFGADAQAFLDAFVNTTEAPREQMITALAENPWRRTFTYLATHDGIPDDQTRLRLLDAALLACLSATNYDLTEDVGNLLAANYTEFQAFKARQSQRRNETTFAFTQRIGMTVASLDGIDTELRQLFINAHLYDLTADNLRTALGIDGPVTLDEVLKNPKVWEYCRDGIEDYFEAVRNDDATGYCVESATVLTKVLGEQHEDWTPDQLGELLSLSSPSAALTNLAAAPQQTWPAVVAAARMVPSVANLTAYTGTNGVDAHLAALLAPVSGDLVALMVDDGDDVETRRVLATRLLNAAAALTDPATRVQLAAGLGLPAGVVEATELTPTGDDLLAFALKAGLVPDTAVTFEHFAAGGWKAVEKAFAASSKVSSFLSPSLVDGLVAALLASSQVPEELRTDVLGNLDKYVTDADTPALKAAGKLALDKRFKLPLAEIRRVASATQDPSVVLPQLVWASAASSEDLVETLVLLGSPYDGLRGGPGHEFELPSGSSNSTLFTRLEKAGKVQIVKKGLRQRRKVKIPGTDG